MEEEPTYNKLAIDRYRSTENGRAVKREVDRRYDTSEAGKARRKRYYENLSEEQLQKRRERNRAYKARKKAEREAAASRLPNPQDFNDSP